MPPYIQGKRKDELGMIVFVRFSRFSRLEKRFGVTFAKFIYSPRFAFEIPGFKIEAKTSGAL